MIQQFKLSESYSIDFVYQETEKSDAMREEMVPVFEYINGRLRDQAEFKHLIPLELTSVKSCLKAAQDGALLWQATPSLCVFLLAIVG